MQLVIFPGNEALPSHSPFCLKAMCLLEMAKELWEPEYSTDVSVGPLGKLPFLRVGDQLIPDSSNIEDFLSERGANFYPGLSPAEISEAHALKSMVEHSLVLCMVHDRWLHEDVWPLMRDEFFAQAPKEMRAEIAVPAQDSVRAGLMGHGIARFSPKDRKARFDRDLATIDSKLGNKPFLFGENPSSADATIAPVLDMIMRLPAHTDLRAATRAKPAFQPYVDRVRAALYPDMSVYASAVTSAAE
ncbi:glutathione S-transferase C-terminal domain-containing protein [Shimia sp. NS0008-38b]|uniref:glutathione S-transferase family protein n=1 Tax=Shimia sp. NS0008-38b TaxID=3127653 RepID=UPI003102F593